MSQRTYPAYAAHVWESGAPVFHHIYPSWEQVLCCGVNRNIIVSVVVTLVEEGDASHWLIQSDDRWHLAMSSRRVAELTASKGDTLVPVIVGLPPDAEPHPGIWLEQAIEVAESQKEKAIRRKAWGPDLVMTVSDGGRYRHLYRVINGKLETEKRVTIGSLPFADDWHQVDWEVVDRPPWW